jgi:8-oxo-dGTP diphosphatase
MSTTAANTANPPPSAVVRVGVGVLVQDPKDPTRVFCGVRKGSHGAGTLALPGGHLELYESWQDCAQREVLEECDLTLDGDRIELGHVTNDPMPSEGKHYVTLFMMAKTTSSSSSSSLQEPKNMEPHKCQGWNSYSWSELEEQQKEGKLFGPLDRLIKEKPNKVLEFLKKKP